ncbi:DUF6942 family protein [Marinagarivorans algicola]|uniref:DUF6942 family protein n=1 Tax=Marinagarivorans algicola TaxID=1513270 RepID=UPI0037364588
MPDEAVLAVDSTVDLEVGLGVSQAPLAIYMANRPVNDHYPTLNHLQPLAPGELSHIVANNTNHWRKVFNVYAKVLWQLKWHQKWPCGHYLKGHPLYCELNSGRTPTTQSSAQSWQEYRDTQLLQAHSHEALLFSAPHFGPAFQSQPHIKIIAGKTYAAALKLPPLTWVDAYFAVNQEAHLVVTPYLDYRQLSNERIETLAAIIEGFKY